MEQETKERNPREHHKLLCFLLAIIVILIVISGSCIYYFCLRSAQLKEELEMLKEKEQSDLNRGVIAETNQISLDETNMTSDIQNSSENMTIYHEVEIKEPGIQVYSNRMDKTKIEDVEKYQTTYYSYELDKVKTEEVYDGTFIVSLNSEITFSNQYDVTPREGKKISELTEELQDLVDYTQVNMLQIDLDGDHQNEYIIQMDREEGESGDKVAEAKSYIFLYDANYQKIADLLEYDSLYKDEIGIDAENKTPYKIAIIVFYKGVSHFNYVIAVYVFI